MLQPRQFAGVSFQFLRTEDENSGYLVTKKHRLQGSPVKSSLLTFQEMRDRRMEQIARVEARTAKESEQEWSSPREDEVPIREIGMDSADAMDVSVFDVRDLGDENSPRLSEDGDISVLTPRALNDTEPVEATNLDDLDDGSTVMSELPNSAGKGPSMEDIYESLKEENGQQRKFWRPPLRVRELVDIPDELRNALGLTPRNPVDTHHTRSSQQPAHAKQPPQARRMSAISKSVLQEKGPSKKDQERIAKLGQLPASSLFKQELPLTDTVRFLAENNYRIPHFLDAVKKTPPSLPTLISATSSKPQTPASHHVS